MGRMIGPPLLFGFGRRNEQKEKPRFLRGFLWVLLLFLRVCFCQVGPPAGSYSSGRSPLPNHRFDELTGSKPRVYSGMNSRFLLFPRFFLTVGKGSGRVATSLEADAGRKAESAGGKRRFLD